MHNNLRDALVEQLRDFEEGDTIIVHRNGLWPLSHVDTEKCLCNPIKLVGVQQVLAYIEQLETSGNNGVHHV